MKKICNIRKELNINEGNEHNQVSRCEIEYNELYLQSVTSDCLMQECACILIRILLAIVKL